jgi:hypothetical protein
MIRLVIALGLLIGFGACTSPQQPGMPWQKAGATDATVAADIQQCRGISQQQAARLYPYSSSNPALGGAGMIAAQQQADIDRRAAELQAFNDCMEARGYTRPART